MARNMTTEMEQLVDWRAALLSGLVGGAAFLLAQMIGWAYLTGGTIWVFPRYVAAIILGERVLLPPTGFALDVFLVALVIHFTLSLTFALVLAAIIHEWTFWVGVVVGALFGLALYAINYYTFSRFFPWFFSVRTWVDVLSHVLFGALTGAVYEWLEIERYVREKKG